MFSKSSDVLCTVSNNMNDTKQTMGEIIKNKKSQYCGGICMIDANNNIINVFRSKADCARFYNTTITLVRTYSEPEIPKLWKKQNVYIRKITLEEYNNHSLDVAA